MTNAALLVSSSVGGPIESTLMVPSPWLLAVLLLPLAVVGLFLLAVKLHRVAQRIALAYGQGGESAPHSLVPKLHRSGGR